MKAPQAMYHAGTGLWLCYAASPLNKWQAMGPIGVGTTADRALSDWAELAVELVPLVAVQQRAKEKQRRPRAPRP